MVIDCSDIQLNKIDAKNQFEIQVLNFFEDWFSITDFMQVKTSGSTGKPKVLDIEKIKMKNSAAMTCDFLGINAQDVALLCLPVEYISGKMMLVRALEKKMKVILIEPSLKPLESLTSSVDFCAMTPLQVENSLDKLHLVKKLIIGGAAVSESLKGKLAMLNTEIYETYGMSETLSHIALKKLRPFPEDFFTCFEGVSIATDDRRCLKIKAPMLNDEILQTNDLVDIIAFNQFKYVGRIDNVINSGGVKVFPEALEALVKKTISNEVVFVGIEDEVLGEKLVLVVEGEKNDEIDELLSSIQYERKLDRPKSLIFISEIPRTENGKVSRLLLKEFLKTIKID